MLREQAGFTNKDLVVELNGLRPTDQTRPGDVVVKNMLGPGQHLIVDVACTTVWSNTNLHQHATVPGRAALHDRESDKFKSDMG